MVLVPQVPRPLSPHWLLRDLSFQSVRWHDGTPLPDGHHRSRNLECLRLAHMLREDRAQLHHHSRQKAMALCAAFQRSHGDTRIPAHGWRELAANGLPLRRRSVLLHLNRRFSIPRIGSLAARASLRVRYGTSILSATRRNASKNGALRLSFKTTNGGT